MVVSVQEALMAATGEHVSFGFSMLYKGTQTVLEGLWNGPCTLISYEASRYCRLNTEAVIYSSLTGKILANLFLCWNPRCCSKRQPKLRVIVPPMYSGLCSSILLYNLRKKLNWKEKPLACLIITQKLTSFTSRWRRLHEIRLARFPK